MKIQTILLCLLIAFGNVFSENIFNPVPDSICTPIKPDAVIGAFKRLSQGSGGKTPTVKQFKKTWIKSLSQRGEPEVYTHKNSSGFEYIGMPIGGLCTGQLYLGGDGKLWWWDIFNTIPPVPGPSAYANPLRRSAAGPQIKIQQGFAIKVTSQENTQSFILDRDGITHIEFCGQYPVGYVAYQDPNLPVNVRLEAFSPFIPLNLKDSSLPVTILNYSIKNRGNKPIKGELGGWLENAVCIGSRKKRNGFLKNKIEKSTSLTQLQCTALKPTPVSVKNPRKYKKDILFEDFETGTYKNWTVEGKAFGKIPLQNYHHQPLSGKKGKYLADSFNNNGKELAAEKCDAPKGKLTSQPFLICRRSIKFLIGGGNHEGLTCLNLLLGGKIIRSATGDNSEAMSWKGFDTSLFKGKMARIEIVDNYSAGWGHIMVDQIVFTDDNVSSIGEDIPLEKTRDYGSLTLTVLGDKEETTGHPSISTVNLPGSLFVKQKDRPVCKKSFSEGNLVGSVGRKFFLNPGEETTVTFILTWYFPNLRLREFGKYNIGREYGKRFSSSGDVAKYVLTNFKRLTDQTRLWHQVWYDSTLPYWFLDRTFLNTSILATNTCYLFRDGRFYGQEGVFHGPGTCTHVWGYVQATGRLFPELERRLRLRVDYNPQIGFNSKTGMIFYRGEFGRRDAVDGQLGIIVRTYRDHQMCENDLFLKKVYPSMKKAMNYMIVSYDKDEDGVLTGSQYNTLDASWYGKIPWLSIYYCTALRAAGQMAEEMGDLAFSRRVKELADKGRHNIEKELFNGEYFFQKADPEHPESPGVFKGCEYSQLVGQSWAYQVGLGYVVDPKKITTALNSLWRYNFSTDVGVFRKKFKSGRWFAMPGEGGLIACTWPNGGSEVLTHGNHHFAGYLNECQNGYAYSASSLMMWHGLVDKALAHIRTVHDRYHASKRNPWNEIEWGTHYSRSMASYGLFTAVCGFEYTGPKGYIAFSPRLKPDNFRAPFTSACGWGTFSQFRTAKIQKDMIEIKWGRLKLKTLGFDLPPGVNPFSVVVTDGDRLIKTSFNTIGRRIMISLKKKIELEPGKVLKVNLGY